MKNNKGITLVALVVTIIILAIIAGVTISASIGENGLLSKSQTQAAKYEEESTRKCVKLAVLSAARAGNGTLNQENLNKYLKEQIGEGNFTVTSINDPEGFKIKVGTLEFTTTKNGVVTEKNN